MSKHEATNRCPAGYTEQEWIDGLQQRLSANRMEQMEAHRSSCAICSDTWRTWAELLSVSEPGPSADASGAARAYPPSRVQLSLRRHAERLARLRRWRRRWPLAVASGAVAATILLLSALYSGGGEPSEAPIAAYVESQVPAALHVLSSPDTSRYRIVAQSGSEGAGYFWLSRDSREALLLLERLPELEFEDYQAWAVRGDRRDSLGLIQHAGGRSHLYLRDDALQQAEMISLSAEPKGGSAQPTSHQVILLLLGSQ